MSREVGTQHNDIMKHIFIYYMLQQQHQDYCQIYFCPQRNTAPNFMRLFYCNSCHFRNINIFRQNLAFHYFIPVQNQWHPPPSTAKAPESTVPRFCGVCWLLGMRKGFEISTRIAVKPDDDPKTIATFRCSQNAEGKWAMHNPCALDVPHHPWPCCFHSRLTSETELFMCLEHAWNLPQLGSLQTHKEFPFRLSCSCMGSSGVGVGPLEVVCEHPSLPSCLEIWGIFNLL